MLRAGEVYENPVTGERAVIRIGTDVTNGELLIVDLTVRPGGAVMGEHTHPAMEERFTMMAGKMGFRVAGKEETATAGVQIIAAPGTPHDWWNAGDKDVLVRVEMRPAARFEEMIRNGFGLAQDGKTDGKGKPGLLQLALFAQEFDDALQFTKPPRWVQKLLFGVLAPIARMAGLRGSYDEYLKRGPKEIVAVEPMELPEDIAKKLGLTVGA
ncbi:MAG TPA: cupin domain-containing protein [Terracidiphilus sp.]|nr:cupin domain-containing protein [Terracidiphilus sp.]